MESHASWQSAAEVPDQEHDEPSPTCTITEAKRRHGCLQTALFYLRHGREALAGVDGTDLTDLDSLIDDAQEAATYYQPATHS